MHRGGDSAAGSACNSGVPTETDFVRVDTLPERPDRLLKQRVLPRAKVLLAISAARPETDNPTPAADI